MTINAPRPQAAPAARVIALRPLRHHPALLCLATVVLILLLYRDSVGAMVMLWSRSQTFAHGFAVVPASVWLAWRQRAHLAALRPKPALAGFGLLLLAGIAWLLAYAANVQVVMQYAVTAMLPATVIATLGWPAARLLAFPLGYLFLAVPFGEVFVAPLIDFTARFTVGALQLTGVPVFRENNHFSIPSGNWSVVEACSGLRYVIASLALGLLYAYLNYRSVWRRIAFVGVALLLPIVANGVRAYLIVMIGHWSDMRLAVGVDHLIYGWLFFGLVSLLLFWCGSFWRDDAPARQRQPQAGAPAAPRALVPAAAIACLALAALWPALASRLVTPPAPPPAPALMVQPGPGWRITADAPPWTASHAGAPLELIQTWHGAPGQVSLQLAWYASQGRDDELLAHLPHPYGEAWLPVANEARAVAVNGRSIALRRIVLQQGAQRLLLWRWYRQGGTDTGNVFLVKLLLAQARLLGRSDGGADIIVSAPYDELAAPPDARLQAFLTAMLPAIQQGLDHAARQ